MSLGSGGKLSDRKVFSMKSVVTYKWITKKTCTCIFQYLNSSPPGAAYMRQWTGSALFQVMACRLFCIEPLPEPMLVCSQLDSCEQISVKFDRNSIISFKKMHPKLSSDKTSAILSMGRCVKTWILCTFVFVIHKDVTSMLLRHVYEQPGYIQCHGWGLLNKTHVKFHIS